jgi:hypothetical protein
MKRGERKCSNASFGWLSTIEMLADTRGVQHEGHVAPKRRAGKLGMMMVFGIAS